MPQAFKGCLKALDAATAMAGSVRSVFPAADVRVLPMADGGDDTLDVLMALGGRTFTATVKGPIGLPVEAQWGVLPDGETAVIEMAQASGLRLLTAGQRDPRVTTTFGTGQLIKAALDQGLRKIVIGVGGSATVDGGIGAITALGGRFLDASGTQLPAGGSGLTHLANIDVSRLDPRAREASILVACDVNMALSGSRGAWRFAAQKGASEQVCLQLEVALEHFGKVVARETGVDLRSMPLAGPAGGLSGGLHAFLGARLQPGAELVLAATGWGHYLAQADLILTGEGMIDTNTFQGKGPGTIAHLAQETGVPVIAVCGQMAADAPDVRKHGIVAERTLMSYVETEGEACARASELIVRATSDALEHWRSTLEHRGEIG